MMTVMDIPSIMTAIPKVSFIANAVNLVKEYWTASLAVERLVGCSIEAQLTTDNSTVGIIPSMITDSTPTERRMKYFNSSCLVAR
jgi:hypothetical protein